MPDWTTPKTWQTGEVVTASDMNAQLRDNIDHLHTRLENYAQSQLNEGADLTTTSATFTNVDAGDTEGKLRHTITTTKANALVLVGFTGNVLWSAHPAKVFFDVTVDGAQVAGNDGCAAKVSQAAISVPGELVSFVIPVVIPTAGSRIFRLVWKQVGSITVTLYAGAGTSNGDLHPHFFVKEM